MMRWNRFFWAVVSLLLAESCFADEKNSELNQKMKQNENVFCSVTETISEVDEKGAKTGEHETVELFSGKPVRSAVGTTVGTSTTYEIEKKTDQIYFKYSMGPVTGSIAFSDATSGANATVGLKLDDLSNKPSLVGQLTINSNDKLKLLQSDDEVQIWTECGIERK